jgi:diacylglycerol O-acyltransferase
MSTRLSSADAAWLHMDRPTNLLVINSVLLFEGPIDWQRVRQVSQVRLAALDTSHRQGRSRRHALASHR